MDEYTIFQELSELGFPRDRLAKMVGAPRGSIRTIISFGCIEWLENRRQDIPEFSMRERIYAAEYGSYYEQTCD